MDKKLTGSRLRKQRNLLNLTREQFAEKIDISPQFLAEIENGTKGMSAETLYKICCNCGISANFLLIGKEHFSLESSNLEKLISGIPSKYLPLIDEYVSLLRKTINL